MRNLIESFIGKLGGTAVIAAIKAIAEKYKPTKIADQKAPRNFFEHFGPNVSMEFVKSKIGAPHRQTESVWSYHFSDALAQFEFSENGSARSVALALTVNSPASGFDLPFLGVPLGKLTLGHFVMEREGKLSYRSSLKTWELLYQVQFPPHWATNYYTFGALSLLTPFSLKESLFNTEEAQRTPRVAAKGALVNWVGISNTPEEIWFDWSIAIPVSA